MDRTAVGHLRSAAYHRQQAALATTIEKRLDALNNHIYFLSRARDVNRSRELLA